MKILQVINSLAIGGAERLLVDLCPRLISRGLECQVVVLTSANDHLSSELLKSGVEVITLSNEPSPYNIVNIHRLNKCIRVIKPDIIHAHLFPVQYYCALAMNQKAVLITTEHNSFNRRMKSVFFRPIEKYIYCKYARVIAISKGVEEALFQYLGHKYPIEVIYNGIDTRWFFNYGGKKRDEDGKIYVGMAARFVPQKDQATIVRAISALPKKYCAIFAGDGENRFDVEDLAENLGISDRIEFAGTIYDIRDLFSQIDIYIQSSNWEGFGIAALEAMAAGLPVISSDVPGLREVIGATGLFFPPGDFQALADVIRQLEPLGKRSEEGAKNVKEAQKYDIEKTVDSLFKLYTSFGDDVEGPKKKHR